MRKLVPAVALIGAAGLVLSGCGGSAPKDNSRAGGDKFKACMVLDVGGVDDKSFNQSAWQGMQEAKKADSDVDVSYVQSSGDSDYEPNLTNSVKKGCKTVISVGGLLSDATTKVAKANPKVHFANVDAPSGAPNVYGITFHSEQGAFLAGYLSASISKTHKVGTWGGVNVGSPVTAYMDGFQQGAEYWGKQKKQPTTVLGWNGKKGAFAGSFTDTGKGASTTQSLVRQGADVVFPVAGAAGGGAFDVAKSSGGKLAVIWVDFPGCDYYPDDCKYIPTSALKAIPEQVKDYVTKAAKGDYPTGTYEGTLENGGSSIDGFHDWDSKIGASTKSELDQIKKDIISGKIKITVNNQ